jgi:YidC/Oxa1 family membrane protein insertase
MKSEARFVLAVILMLGVLVGTSLLFPPAPVDEEAQIEATSEGNREGSPGSADGSGIGGAPGTAGETGSVEVDPLGSLGALVQPPVALPELTDPGLPEGAGATDEGTVLPVPQGAASSTPVVVETPLMRLQFSTRGGVLESAQMLRFDSFTREGPVELLADATAGTFGNRLVVGADTVDLRGLLFEVEPADGRITLEGDDAPATVTFRYTHPTRPFSFEIRHQIDPTSYLIATEGRVRGLERALLVTDLGRGLAFNELDPKDESRAAAYALKHLQDGVTSKELGKVDRPLLVEGPLNWAAVRSRYFVMAMLPSAAPAVDGGAEWLGGLLVRPETVERADGTLAPDARLAVTQMLGSGGTFAFRVFAGPQDYGLLTAVGDDLQEVNPVGWRWLRPVIRPFVAGIMWVLVYLHETLSLGYGWVLVIFGVMIRVVLFPLYHKAMRAQLRNMVVQPLLKEIQTKYKDNPERLQKELMKLYKEHGFNPLAGCWPMLLPWPILIALFFVFQNTIELRGVPFAWLPDLSAKDPLYILPLLLGASMFLLQWISMRTIEDLQPQMKIMMYVLPIMMVVFFAAFPSGLNLYYLTMNLATLPQSWWIAQERVKMQKKAPAPAVT